MATPDAPPAIVAPESTRPPLVTRSRELVESSALQQRVFDSWEQFHEHLSAYGQRTAQRVPRTQLFSVRSATPAARRNDKVRKRKSSAATQLIPERFSHYVKTIACTHGGKPRPRSTGVRPNHQHRAIECPAQINACVKKDEHGVWRVYVTHQNAWHNHEVSAAIYNGYPEVRNAYSPDVLATINVLRKAEAQRKKIHEYIVENTPHNVKMKDVHNLLSKMSRTNG